MGIELLSKLPSLVVLKGRRPPTLRQGRNTLSIVDGLIWQNCASISADMILSSPCFLKTVINSGRNDCKRLEHNRSAASHTIRNASTTTSPYHLRCPRFLLVTCLFLRRSSLIAVFRWQPVTLVYSSSILLFSVFDATTYRPLISSAYSRMLPRVMPPSFWVALFVRQRYYFW